jgi:monovalent cation:H+ antiporter-2, CPA2 family
MLLNPALMREYWLPVLLVVLAIMAGKGLIAAVTVYAAGVHGRTAVLTGLGLAQIGEFSFLLAGMGERQGLIEPEISAILLAAALITILLTPLVYGSSARIYGWLNQSPLLSRVLNRAPAEDLVPHTPPVDARVIILGCGRVGRYVSDALRAMSVPHVVVDYDGGAVERLAAAGVPAAYGDATSEVVIKHTHPEKAELAVVALPEAAITEMAVRLLKRLAPKLPVVARVHRGIDIPRVRAAGADAVIHAEFEAGVEMIRQGLDRLGVPDPHVDAYLEGVRQHRYRQSA